jgi:UDP-N-acetylglucosamine 1-carboxyvinyltransferase
MDKIKIKGGQPLYGRIAIGGAKNAALPLMVASLLTDMPLELDNLPTSLADIRTLISLLAQHGVVIEIEGEDADGLGDKRLMRLTAKKITSTVAPYDLVRKMRASVLVLGPLLARERQAKVSLPGGCAIGNRPVDLHLRGLEAMGAQITLSEGYIHAAAPEGLKGARILFPKVSVGATENLLMAACLAEGESELINAAREPEVSDLALCLKAMGAEIDGIGTDHLVIKGKSQLHGARHSVVPDRIETGTYLMATAIAGGEIILEGGRLEHLEAAVKLLRETGVYVAAQSDGTILVRRSGARLLGVDAMTEPYPGFPTDLQAQFMTLMTLCHGASMVTETIFENRFMHVPELTRMGANITVHGSSALVRGVEHLNGAPVMATDLRASVSLVLAGLAARGETVVSRIYHLDRGYERLELKLAACGAAIARIKGE